MGAVGNWLVGAWNYVVSIAPTVMEAVCKVVNDGAKTVTF